MDALAYAQPASSTGQRSAKTSDGLALATHPQYSQGLSPAWMYTQSALLSSKTVSLKRDVISPSVSRLCPFLCERAFVRAVGATQLDSTRLKQ